MNRTANLTLLILLGSTCVAAQTDSNGSRGFAVLVPMVDSGSGAPGKQILQMPGHVVVPADSGCPVAMSARQASGGELMKAASGQRQTGDGPGQRINLGFSGGKSAQLLAATVRVRGLTPATRALPAEQTTSGANQATRTLHLTFGDDAAVERAAELVLRGFTSVSYVDLVSLTYADGSTWTQGEQVCRVRPDPLMLIGAR